MGRERGSRAKQKLLTRTNMHLSRKRNRDKTLKGKRKAFQDMKKDEVRAKTSQFVKNPKNTNFQKAINEKFLNRVRVAQNSLEMLGQSINQAQTILIVLDARDPQSFRSIEVEKIIEDQGKRFYFVINKIDLVPPESVEIWLQFLNKVVPTIAITTNDPKSASLLLNQLLQDEKSVVIGLPQVGKTSISKLNEHTVDSEGWMFTNSGESPGLSNSLIWKGRTRELCSNFIERSRNESIYKILELKVENSVGNLLNSYSRKARIPKSEAADHLINRVLQGEIKWFSTPDGVENSFEISENQKKAIELCSKDDISTYVHLLNGTSITLDKKALEFILPAQEEEESEEEETEPAPENEDDK